MIYHDLKLFINMKNVNSFVKKDVYKSSTWFRDPTSEFKTKT